MTTTYDLDTPQGRYAASQALGTAGYNAAMKAHHRAGFVVIVNGYGLRWVSTRFGRLCQVYGEGTAFHTRDEAEAYARTLPAGPEV